MNKSRRNYGIAVRDILTSDYDVSDVVASVWTTGRHSKMVSGHFFDGSTPTQTADSIASSKLGRTICR